MKQSKKRKIVNIAIFAAILMGRGFSCNRKPPAMPGVLKSFSYE